MKRLLFSLILAAAFLPAFSQEFFLPPYTIEPSSYSADAGQVTDYWHAQLKTAKAWQTNRGEGAVIFILDTGLPDHEDIDKTGNQYAANFTPEPIKDVNNHASACAGVAAAIDNDRGTLGAAPGVLLVFVKVMRGNGTGFAGEIESGIKYAADVDLGPYNNRVRILSMSFGASQPIPQIETALKYAESKGCILSASAGNSGYVEGGNTLGYPARYEFVISVASVGKSQAPSGFSSGGQGLDVTSFGEAVYTCNASGSYSNFSGTSFSEPITAGVQALIATKYQSQFKAAGAKANALMEEMLRKNAADIFTPGYDVRTGYGLAEATIVEKPLPSSPVDPPAPGPAQTYIYELSDSYKMIWRQDGSTNFQTTMLFFTISYTTTEPDVVKANAELKARLITFFNNRGFVLFRNSNLLDALRWGRHFTEMLVIGVKCDLVSTTIGASKDKLLLPANVGKTTAQVKKLQAAVDAGLVYTVIFEQK